MSKTKVELEKRVSLTQLSNLAIQRPTFMKFLRRMTKFNEEIHRYFISQALLGFLFYRYGP